MAVGRCPGPGRNDGEETPGRSGRLGGRGLSVASAGLLSEREMWRVEAGNGMTSTGVFDLSFSWTDGNWQLLGCAD